MIFVAFLSISRFLAWPSLDFSPCLYRFSGIILGFGSLFEIDINLIIYALTLLSLCWFLALLFDLLVEFSRLEKSGVVRRSHQWQLVSVAYMRSWKDWRSKINHSLAAKGPGWIRWLLYPLGPSNENTYSDQPPLNQWSETSQIRHQLESELFKIEQYTGLVLNYLRLQSFHDDLVIEPVHLDELIRTLVKKYSLFLYSLTIVWT